MAAECMSFRAERSMLVGLDSCNPPCVSQSNPTCEGETKGGQQCLPAGALQDSHAQPSVSGGLLLHEHAPLRQAHAIRTWREKADSDSEASFFQKTLPYSHLCKHSTRPVTQVMHTQKITRNKLPEPHKPLNRFAEH